MTIDLELAEQMTREVLYKDIADHPEANDFYYPIKYANKLFTIHWMKDVNVVEPKWHISIVGVKDL